MESYSTRYKLKDVGDSTNIKRYDVLKITFLPSF